MLLEFHYITLPPLLDIRITRHIRILLHGLDYIMLPESHHITGITLNYQNCFMLSKFHYITRILSCNGILLH